MKYVSKFMCDNCQYDAEMKILLDRIVKAENERERLIKINERLIKKREQLKTANKKLINQICEKKLENLFSHQVKNVVRN